MVSTIFSVGNIIIPVYAVMVGHNIFFSLWTVQHCRLPFQFTQWDSYIYITHTLYVECTLYGWSCDVYIWRLEYEPIYRTIYTKSNFVNVRKFFHAWPTYFWQNINNMTCTAMMQGPLTAARIFCFIFLCFLWSSIRG